MKYIVYLLFIAFIVVLFLFLKNALQPKQEPVSVTGSEECGECHKLKINGNQQEVWENSKHSLAYKILLGDIAKNFAVKSNIEAPEKNKLCLSCHTTQNYLGDFPVQSSYRIEEGVGCESCHGAGSKYSPSDIMSDDASFRRNGGKKGNEENCSGCHSPKGNKEMKISENVCPFQQNDFDFKTAFEKIKHPVNKDNFK